MKDRVAIITGASGGLGTVAAQQFAKRGARLAVLDRSPERLEQSVADLWLTNDRCLLSTSPSYSLLEWRWTLQMRPSRSMAVRAVLRLPLWSATSATPK